MTGSQKAALHALHDVFRQYAGQGKMGKVADIEWLGPDRREEFIGWVLETITPELIVEFVGKSEDESVEAPEPEPETAQ